MQNKSIALFAILVVLATLVGPSFQADKLKKTECQIKRDNAEQQLKRQERNKDFGIAILVPKCDAEGNYESVQCHHNSPFCQCWTKDGYPVSAPKKNLSKCACLIEKNTAKGSAASSINCKPDGTFEEKRCTRSGCFCVHPETGKEQPKGTKC